MWLLYIMQVNQVDDENFLLPTKEEFSSKEDVLDFGVSVQDIMRYLRAQTNEVNKIFDACRDNPFESNWIHFIKRRWIRFSNCISLQTQVKQRQMVMVIIVFTLLVLLKIT